MKILFINDYGFQEGGVETYLQELEEALFIHGHEVRMLTSNAGIPKKLFSDYVFKSTNTKGKLRFIPYLFNLRSIIRLKQVLDEYKPDIVHLHYYFYHTSPSILLLLSKIPTIMTLHAHEIIAPVGIKKTTRCEHNDIGYCIYCVGFSNYLIETLKRMIFRLLSKNIDGYIAPSNYYNKLHQKIGLKNIITINNAINPFKYADLPKGNNILYVGRLVREKGVQVLLKAIPQLLDSLPNLHLTIVGEGTYSERLKLLTHNLKIDNAVTFVGKVSRNELYKFYKNACIVIVPSIWQEPFALVGIEAMSVGRPVIGSNVGGISDWLKDRITGFLVKPNEPSEISKSVLELFSNRTALSEMSKNSQLNSKNFTMQIHTANVLRFYKNILKKYQQHD